MTNLLDSDVPTLKKNPMKPTKYVSRPSTGSSTKVDKKMLSWYGWLVSHVPEPIKRPVSMAFARMKEKVMSDEIRNNNKNTSPTDFLVNVKSSMQSFFKSHPNNKIQLGLICNVTRLDPSSTNVIDSESPAFLSNNESVFPKSDLEDFTKICVQK